ncbi:MAG: alanine racemase [Bdellovibrionales bacterium]|nr:alanine racemase [Bdellovibrionales bacterium]
MHDSDITPRPTVATIDLDALEHNFSVLNSFVAPAKVMAVIKANAYGHGLLACGRQLERCGAAALGVAFLEEGVALRKAGLKLPILVLGGIFEGQIQDFLTYDLDITASSLEKLTAINARAAESGKRARVHLKIDTGMNRIGVRAGSAPALVEAAVKASHCDVVGIFSHLATADEEPLDDAREQVALFKEVLSGVQSLIPDAVPHIANSAAMLRIKESQLGMVRPGVALFGNEPSPGLRLPVELRQVMKLESRVVFFKVIPAGAGVSYGHRWRAEKQSRLVTIPLGYGDGYTRHYSNVASVLIRGKRYPVVGSVCMDQLMVNIGDDEAYNGDEVVLIGAQGGEKITAGELAELSGTVPHEVTTAISSRVPRRFIRGGKQIKESQV